MLIPLGTDRPLHRPSAVTILLIALNVGVFGAQLATQPPVPGMVSSFEASLILNPESLRTGEKAWTFVTYAFLHGGWMHLILNMVFLWAFGPNVEDRLGKTGFLGFYLVGAATAGVVHAATEPAPVVGASGAVAAVTGAYLVLFPRTLIRTLFFFFFIGIVQIPAWWFIGAQIAWNLMSQATGATGRVAVTAHLGGYAYGIAISMLLLALHVLPPEQYDLFTLGRQAKRRRDFRAASEARQKNREQRHKHVAESEASEAVATARANVSKRLAAGDAPGATEAYKTLLREHGHDRRATLLSRRHQYDLANALYLAGDYVTAASAYERFIEGYPDDPETPAIKLLLGRILARQLNDPVRAKQLLAEAAASLEDGDALAMAREELEALG